MLKHRPVDFFEDINTHFDAVVGRDANNVGIECRVMELAQGQSIRDTRLPLRVAIRDNVRCLQQLMMPQAANRAVLAIPREHPLPERLLVEPLAHKPGDVPSAEVRFDAGDWSRNPHELALIDGDREGQRRRVVPDDVDGPRRHIAAHDDAVLEARYALFRQGSSGVSRHVGQSSD